LRLNLSYKLILMYRFRFLVYYIEFI
jgi:hypothetical protein